MPLSPEVVDIVIPARGGSERFPNKPLAQLAGASVLHRVWQSARAVKDVRQVLVASDDDKILRHAEQFGAAVVQVDAPCRNGSERVAHAVALRGDVADVVVNMQGDAPLVPPYVVQATIAALKRAPEVGLMTPAVQLLGASYVHYVARKEGGRSSGTTVVCNGRGDAMYFSKAVLPKLRQPLAGAAPARQHVGLYAFRRAALATYAALAPTPLELQEGLEQLRWLEHGLPLRVVEVELAGRTLWSIDHPEDLEVAAAILAREGDTWRCS